MSDEPASSENNAPSERSPSFPMVPLKTAIERLEQFETKFGRHPAPYTKAGLAWGMKEGSGQANRVLAALKGFGLIQYSGSGVARSIAISDTGRTYLRAQQEHIKQGVIKDAALKPKAIAKFWPDWGADRPVNEICLDDLVLKHGFTDKAARDFLRVYDETIDYAGLSNSDKVDVEVNGGEADEESVVDEDNRDDESPPPPENERKVKVMQGERELTTGLLAKDASFRLIVSGKIGAKEIDRLIAKLELDKEILAEETEADPAENEEPAE